MTKSKEFYSAWLRVTENRKLEISENWNDNKSFTRLMLHSDTSIIFDVASILELYCCNTDYYNIDSVLFKPEDQTPDTGGLTLRDLRIAFEHENNFKSGLYQEVSHLLLLNCDLKVLVTYSNDSEKNINTELDYLHNIITGNRSSSEISENESFLIIIGHGCSQLESWTGYVYKSDSWKCLGNG